MFTLTLVSEGTTGAQPDSGAPLELTALARAVHQVDLHWRVPALHDGCSTTVWRNDGPLAVLCGPVTSFVDATALPATRYRYRLVDTGGPGVPLVSGEVAVTTPALPDTADGGPPSAVPGLEAVAASDGVRLVWQDASDDTDLSVYEVRRDGLLLAEVNAATLRYLDRSIEPGASVRYAVVAVDVLGQSSQPTVVAATAWVPTVDAGSSGATTHNSGG